MEPVTQSTLKFGEGFYFSGAVRSRLKRGTETIQNSESDLEDL